MARKASLAPNLAVIAQKLGISRSTACRALRNANDVGLETRLRVVQTARELGYVVPQRSGPADAPKGHQVMVLSQCGEYGPDQGYMAGMSRSSIPLNLVLLTHHLSGDECMKIVEAENQPVAMQQGMVDGLVFLHRWPTEVVAKLSAKTPSVSVIHYYSQGNGDFVGIDNRFGMELIVNHLVRGGHRKIGFFGLYDQMSWARSRYCGFIEALRMAGLPFVPESVLEMEQSGQIPNEEYPDNGWKEKVLARMKTGVDAWVCSSEGIGWELCRFLLSRGFRIPEDVAVTGYHRKYTREPKDLPMLTTIEIPDEELGAAALRMLERRFAYPREARQSLLLAPSLAIMESTRPGTETVAAHTSREGFGR